jgi:hypothetical protein
MLEITRGRFLSGMPGLTAIASLGLFSLSWIPRFIGLILRASSPRDSAIYRPSRFRRIANLREPAFLEKLNDRGRTPDRQYGRGGVEVFARGRVGSISLHLHLMHLVLLLGT